VLAEKLKAKTEYSQDLVRSIDALFVSGNLSAGLVKLIF